MVRKKQPYTVENLNKNKVMSGLTLLLAAGFLLVILISFFVSRHSLRNQIVHDSLPLTSDNIYSEIQRDLLRPIFISSLMASDTFVRDWLLLGEKNPKDLTRYLKEIMAKYEMFTAFLVSEKSRKYYHPNGIIKKVDQSEERDEWYFRVRQMKQPYEINVDIDMANKDALTVFVNYRMYDYAGEYIGATGVGLTVRAVKQLIDNYEKQYHRRIYFVDQSGKVMLAGRMFPEKISSLYDIDGLDSTNTWIIENEGGAYSYSSSGATVHLISRYIPEFEWYLVVEEEETDVLRQVFVSLLINLAICGVVITVILLITNRVISGYQKSLEELAITDKLTGVYNRRAFDLFMSQILREAERSQEHLSLIIFDIDNFKRVNDQYGHLAGDKTIQEIVRITRGLVRNSDIICRWGGEEFLLIMRGCDEVDSLRMAEKIRAAVESHTTYYEGRKIAVTISFGVAENIQGDKEDILLSRADGALYLAKQAGRNCVKAG